MQTIDGELLRGIRARDTARTPVCTTVDEWTPILDGDIYCSPRCGCRCKKAAYDDAVAAADAAARELGEGWSPRVWENMGWHSSVSRGKSEVHIARRRGTFTCFFNSDVKQFIVTAATATEAVNGSMQLARAELRMLERQIMNSGMIPRTITARDDITDL